MGRRRTSEHGKKSGLPWFKLRNDVATHPKVQDLAALLKMDRHAALGLWVEVLCYASKYAPTGKVTNGARTARAVIADGALSARERDPVVDAMLRVGMLEELGNGGLEVHDWWQEQGPHVARAWSDAEDKRALREAQTKAKEEGIRRAPNSRRSRAESAFGANLSPSPSPSISPPTFLSDDGAATNGEPSGGAVPLTEADFFVPTTTSPGPLGESRAESRDKRGGGGEGKRGRKVVDLPFRSKLIDTPEDELDADRADHCLELLQRYRTQAFTRAQLARENLTVDLASRFIDRHTEWKGQGYSGAHICNAFIAYLKDEGPEAKPFSLHSWMLPVFLTDGVSLPRLLAARAGHNTIAGRRRRHL